MRVRLMRQLDAGGEEGGRAGRVMDKIIACHTCDLVQRIDRIPEGMIARCARCGSALISRKIYSRRRTLAFSMAAFILYFPANIYPIATAEYMGAHSETTIWNGVNSLFKGGSYFVAALVFTTSILSPGLKILGLLFLSWTVRRPGKEKEKTWVYKVIEFVNPWNMLEVYLLAILVSIVELGKIATVHPGLGVLSFASMVVLTNLASLSFDPKLIWDPREE